MEKIIFIIKSGINLFLEILFPSRCIGCNKKSEILCSYCVEKLKLTDRQTENQITAVYDYRDPVVKKAIWRLKYHHSKYLGQKLGELLSIELLEEINEIKTFSMGSPIYIIPVPISHDRKKIRGYNQSEILARSFCDYTTGVNLQIEDNIIFKKKNTIAQAKITNKNKRLKNIKGVFEINKKIEIKGKTFIIIDDVTTTGGTIGEIIKILKNGGAKKVVGFAFAH